VPYPQIALALLGAWSIFPPYVGPVLGLELNVAAKVEVVDHVVPGVSIALCAALAALLARRGAEAEYGTPALVLGGVCFLGGLWQAATHAPLVFDAGGSEAPWGAVLLHSTPGPALVVVALWLILRTPKGERVAA